MNNCNCSGNCPTLYFGGRGSAVTFVQRLLRERRYRVTIDGYFGQETRAAVLAFQRNNRLPQTGNVDSATWRALGVTCWPGGNHQPETLPIFPSTPDYPEPDSNQPVILPVFPSEPNYPEQDGHYPETLPIFPTTPVEPSVDGLNYVWQELGDFRYVLATNKSRYAIGEPIEISFRKRNISNETQILRYPSAQLFDFYISGANGNELYRWSDVVDFGGIPHEMILAPGEAETVDLIWRQRTSNGQPITPQQLTLWGVNTAVNISIPLQFTIY